MKKCEWKDGVLEVCEEIKTLRNRNLDTFNNIFWGIFKAKPNYCFCCGADIRKPEPQIIIKKSGETWVKRDNKVDYLLMNPSENMNINLQEFGPDIPHCVWKPITRIEITDEIAKLRPMIKREGFCGLEKLYGIDYGTIITNKQRFVTQRYSLATVSDLEEV